MEYGMNMSWIVFIAIGVVIGWLARRMMKDAGFGRVWDIVAGIIGALLGGVFFSNASVSSSESMLGSLIVATLSAMALTVGVRLFKKLL
jgi:uncharacterized membrane protein YeaQ/YmgE (transglycosylase-associated protein family)